MNSRLPSVLFSIICLASCTSSKDKILKLEKNIIPAQWHTELKHFELDSNESYWSNAFHIPALTQVLKLSHKNNPELDSMLERVIAQGEDATIAGANISPIASANLSGTRSKRNLIGFNFPNSEMSFTSNSFNAGINISWELDIWGKIKDYKKSAEKRFEASTSEYKAARESLNGQIAKTWFSLLENKFQIELIQKTTETYSKNQIFINDRYRRGLASALEQQLADASLSLSRANLAQRQRNKEILSRSVQKLVGEYPDGNFDLNSSLNLPELSLPPLPPTPSAVVEARHDLTSARLQIEASGYNLGIAKKSLLPSFSLIGGPGSRSDNFEDLIDQKFRVWDISTAVSQPLFQGGRLRAGIRKAESLKRSALSKYKSLALNAFSEVEDTLSAENYLAKEEKNLKESYIALSKAAELSWERYQRGLEGIFNTLETRRRAFEAESRFLSLKKERIFNRINLYLAIGMNAIPPES